MIALIGFAQRRGVLGAYRRAICWMVSSDLYIGEQSVVGATLLQGGNEQLYAAHKVPAVTRDAAIARN